MIIINDGIAAVNGSNVECLKKFLINEPLKDIIEYDCVDDITCKQS